MTEDSTAFSYPPDSHFASAFSIADADVTGPLRQTPWCGNWRSLDRRQLTGEGWGQENRRTQLFKSPPHSFNRDYVAGRREDQPRLRIVRAETSDFDVYVFDFPAVHNGERGGWFDDVVASYKCAVRLGTFVPTPVIGDGWWAIQSFDGVPYRDICRTVLDCGRRPKEEHCRLLCWELARLTIVGHIGLGPNSTALTQDGRFLHGSFEESGRLVKPHAHRYVAAAKTMTSLFQEGSQWYYAYEDAVCSLAEYLASTELLEPYATPRINENIAAIPEIFPINPMSEEYTPQLTRSCESIIPEETTDLRTTLSVLDRRGEVDA